MNPLVPIGLAAAGLGLYAYKKNQDRRSGAAARGVMSASSAASAPTIAASWHAGGMSVHDVQQALNQLGATPPLAVDGVAGPKTIAAVKSFQSQAGITVDGVVGPETTAALERALGGGHQVMGYFDVEGYDEGDEDEEDLLEEVDLYDERIVGTSFVSGFAESDWSAPDVGEISRDPRQMEQIGLMQLWKQKAEQAFGPGTAYAYAQPSGVDVQGAMGQASEELEAISGGELGGVHLTSGAWDGDDGGWSAPDIEEAYADPEQVAEMWGMAAHAMPYGYPLPYAATPPMFGPPPGAYPFAPAPIAGTYPYGPMNVPPPPQVAAAMPGTYPYGPANVVPGRGYEFASQPGRRY